MVTAIIAAAGLGKRMGRGINKVFIPLCNRPLISYTLDAFESCTMIDDIIVVVGGEDVEHLQDIVKKYAYGKIRAIVVGGTERQYSIANALKKLSECAQWVLIHDGARPLISQSVIKKAIESVKIYNAVGVGVPVKDTIKVIDKDGFVTTTPDRNVLWAIQTPQVFARNVVVQAYRHAEESGITATDDAALVEQLGVRVKLLMGDYTNLKVTTPEDIMIAEAILRGKN
jgi:2-C-methyl-D-erythritol 4-phosphate cytidylyltransferase